MCGFIINVISFNVFLQSLHAHIFLILIKLNIYIIIYTHTPFFSIYALFSIKVVVNVFGVHLKKTHIFIIGKTWVSFWFQDENLNFCFVKSQFEEFAFQRDLKIITSFFLGAVSIVEKMIRHKFEVLLWKWSKTQVRKVKLPFSRF